MKLGFSISVLYSIAKSEENNCYPEDNPDDAMLLAITERES